MSKTTCNLCNVEVPHHDATEYKPGAWACDECLSSLKAAMIQGIKDGMIETARMALDTNPEEVDIRSRLDEVITVIKEKLPEMKYFTATASISGKEKCADILGRDPNGQTITIKDMPMPHKFPIGVIYERST